MKSIKALSFLKKKKLLDDPHLPAATCREYGDLCLAQGWLADALDFYVKGQDTAGLEKLQAIAVATGDAFLLERLLQAQGRQDPALWQQVAAAAAAAGKETLARWAQERAAQGGEAAGSPTSGSDHAHDA
jgi:hypothetical protein